MNRVSIDNLTGVRFIAAGLVVLYHYMNSSEYVAPVFLKNIVGHGYIGVNFFYILSGYILTYNYDSSRFSNLSSKLNFWRARFARVYPLYIFTFVLMFGILVFQNYVRGNISEFFNYKNNLYMIFYWAGLQNWFVYYTGLLHVPSWSISCEIFFYFMFPFLIRRVEVLKRPFIVIASLLTSVLFLTIFLSSLSDSADFVIFIKFFPLFHLPIFVSE